MPRLKKILVQDFRNIEFQELAFSPNVNCISGNNGEGKTNLLDAVYYLSMTKSAFSTSDRYNFRYGKDMFSLSGLYSMENGSTSRIVIQTASNGTKKVRRDDKLYQKVSAHIGLLPVVTVSPMDISMVSESGEERRRFANSVLSQMDPEYLAALQQYTRLLLQRNKLLKERNWDEALLGTYDQRMSSSASVIHEGRKRLVEEMAPIVQEQYRMLSGGVEEVSIQYKSDLSTSSLEEILKSSRERDSILGYTTAGIQRDDFEFLMNGHPIRRNGSQGQQKSFLVSLKFAQYFVMRESYGFPPMLILDDVFDKLDMERVRNLLKMVAGNDFGQIFITDSNKVRMQNVVGSITSDCSFFVASNGTYTQG